MELKEAMTIAKTMESHFEAFAKLSEFIKLVLDIQRTNEGAEKKFIALKKEFDGLAMQKAAMEAEIAKRKKEAAAEHEVEIAKIKNEEKALTLSLSQAKMRFGEELEGLSSKKAATIDKMDSEIRVISEKKANLESEVGELANAKATLEAEIQAIKDKFSVLVK